MSIMRFEEDVAAQEFFAHPHKDHFSQVQKIYIFEKKEWTCIEIAAYLGNIPALQILLSKNYCYRRGSNAHKDAFMAAARNHQTDVVRLILEKWLEFGSHFEADMKSVFAALLLEDLSPVLQFILNSEYNELLIALEGHALLAWACRHKFSAWVHHFLKFEDIIEAAGQDNKVIIDAIKGNDRQIISKLLEYDSVTSHIRHAHGIEVLAACLKSNNLDLFIWFIQDKSYKLESHLATKDNYLLKLCIQMGDLRHFKYLLKFEAPRALFHQKRQDYLFEALKYNHMSIIDFLLRIPEVRENVHFSNNKFLHKVIEKGMQALALKLLKMNNVIHHLDGKGFHEFWLAFNHHQTAVVSEIMAAHVQRKKLNLSSDDLHKHLYKIKINKNNPLNLAAQKGQFDLFFLFFQYEDILKKSFLGAGNPLIYAAESGCTEIIDLFMTKLDELDLDIQVAFSKSMSKIFAAAFNNQREDFLCYLMNYEVFRQHLVSDFVKIVPKAVDYKYRKLLSIFEHVLKPFVMNYSFNIQTLEGDISELRFRAAYKETAMQDTKTEEHLGLSDLFRHYAPAIDAFSLAEHLEHLVHRLAEKYIGEPIVVMIGDGRKIELPLTWDDFQLLLTHEHFSFETVHKFKQAYYNHSIHSAWRYLQQPNHWMSQDAENVIELADNSGYCADFRSETRLLICMWLAAKDTEFLPTEDAKMSVQDRELFFFNNLGNMNRSNNSLMIGQDTDGDKPVCPIGLKNMLIHSLLAHPLMVLLTDKFVHTELISYMSIIWKQRLQCLSFNDLHALHELWQSSIVYRMHIPYDEEQKLNDLLASFHLSETDISGFYARMEGNFGEKWRSADKLHAQLKNFYSIEKSKFQHLVEKYGNHFHKLLSEEYIRQSKTGFGFFDQQPQAAVQEHLAEHLGI